jgi:hypothetical protein
MKKKRPEKPEKEKTKRNGTKWTTRRGGFVAVCDTSELSTTDNDFPLYG